MGAININRFFKTVPGYPQIAEVRKELADFVAEVVVERPRFAARLRAWAKASCHCFIGSDGLRAIVLTY
jgi:hypothetical protein